MTRTPLNPENRTGPGGALAFTGIYRVAPKIRTPNPAVLQTQPPRKVQNVAPRSRKGRLGVGMGVAEHVVRCGGVREGLKRTRHEVAKQPRGGCGGIRTHDPRGHGCGNYPLRHGEHAI